MTTTQDPRTVTLRQGGWNVLRTALRTDGGGWERNHGKHFVTETVNKGLVVRADGGRFVLTDLGQRVAEAAWTVRGGQ